MKKSVKKTILIVCIIIIICLAAAFFIKSYKSTKYAPADPAECDGTAETEGETCAIGFPDGSIGFGTCTDGVCKEWECEDCDDDGGEVILDPSGATPSGVHTV